MENILSIQGLCKEYTGSRALDNVSLEVPEGSVFGLLGPNGAGKTTMLRIINNILAKDSGTVTIAGRESGWETSSLVGYMPEERGLYDKMRVTDQIRYFGKLKGANPDTINANMEEYLHIFNLDKDRNRRIRELSKGNQQKVQIVATIVHEPRLVILDEPFSGFDPINSQLLTDLIARLHQKGTTIMLSSHNMPAVESMCSHIGLIDHGRMLLQGNLAEIKQTHKTGDLKVCTSTPLTDSVLADKSLLAHTIYKGVESNGQECHTYMLRTAEGVTNNDLLMRLTYSTGILHFEQMLPTLEEIFLRYTTGKNE